MIRGPVPAAHVRQPSAARSRAHDSSSPSRSRSRSKSKSKSKSKSIQAVGARGASVTPTGDTGRPVSNSIWGHCVCPERGDLEPRGEACTQPGARFPVHIGDGDSPRPTVPNAGGCRGRRCKDQRLNGRLSPGNAPLVGASRPSVAQAPATRLPALRRSIDPVGIARAEGMSAPTMMRW